MGAEKLNEKIEGFLELIFIDNFYTAMAVFVIVAILFLTGMVAITIKCKILT